MSRPNPFVSIWYPCLAPPEAAQVALLLVYQVPGIIYVPRGIADTTWVLSGQTIGSARWGEWERMSGATVVVVPVGDGEVEEFYSYPLNPWVQVLALIQALPPMEPCYLTPEWTR